MDVSITGRIKSFFLSGNKVKQTRYAHQVSLVSLVELSTMSSSKTPGKTIQRETQLYESIKEKSSSMLFRGRIFILILSNLLAWGDFTTFLEFIKTLILWFFALFNLHALFQMDMP